MSTDQPLSAYIPEDEPNDWLQDLHLDIRELKTLRACLVYADPEMGMYGDVAHNLKVLVAKMARLLGDDSRIGIIEQVEFEISHSD
jgi:hypothetical protein